MPKPYELNTMGHEWQLDEFGEIDIFAYLAGKYHNGPRCKNCGYGFCHHCQDMPEVECKAVLTLKEEK